MQTAKDLLELWSRWLYYGRYGSGETVIAKMRRGMKSLKCPTCRGEGDVLRYGQNGNERVLCPTCEGACAIDPHIKIPRHPSRECPQCEGKGSVGEDKKTCFPCRGRGRILGRSINDKVFPAFILSTAPGFDDPIYYRVDRFLSKRPRREQAVVYEAYLGLGTQEIMATRLRRRKHRRYPEMTQQLFSRLLNRVHEAVENEFLSHKKGLHGCVKSAINR
jgi:hypothetical protein